MIIQIGLIQIKAEKGRKPKLTIGKKVDAIVVMYNQKKQEENIQLLIQENIIHKNQFKK